MDDRARKQRSIFLVGIAIVLAIAAVAVAFLFRRRRREPSEAPRVGLQPLSPEAVLELQGLSEAEAAARKQEGQDNVIIFKPPRSPREIWRTNIYTIFNLSLVGLAAVQVLIGKPLDAVISLGVMLLNIGLNVGQELFARRRLKDVEQATRAQATVIREAKARSIDPSDIVKGDILVAGPGDQILVDGQVVGEGQMAVSESMLTGDSQRHTKSAGDRVYAGSFCLAGRAAYEAQIVGDERLIVGLTGEGEASPEELTPLERTMDGILRALLVVVAVYTILFMIRYFQLDTYIPVETINNAVSVIFNIAPATLFFMIVLTYAAGTADLGKLGALVHRARSVESMAQTNVLCFARAGILTGTHVEVDLLDPRQDQPPLAESRLRQILGDFARSLSTDSLVTRAMIATFPGNRRAAQDQAPFLSVHGWSAVLFDDDDLQGVYILGEPQILEAHLVPSAEEEAETGEEKEAQPPAWRRVTAPLGRLFRRSSASPEEDESQAEESPPTGKEPGQEQEQQDSPSPKEDERRGNLFQRLTKRVRGVVSRQETSPPEEAEPEDAVTEETHLLFAYWPELAPLHSPDGLPQLPDKLFPLCDLRYTERVRPEAIETIRGFSEMGVEIKILSERSPDQTMAILRQAGFGQNGEKAPSALSGPELAEMGAEEWPRAAADYTIFGRVTPEQGGQVVEALRQARQQVAVVGDGVNDLPALQQANLAIARQSSSQAALSVADIILLDDSPQALLRVLDKGQRIVNGLLDVLKLYLVQAFYLMLLVLAVSRVAGGFPYLSGQGSVIAIVTVQLPALALSLWAVVGVLPGTNLRWLLIRFSAPAAITMSAAGLVVYVFFLESSGEIAYAQIALTHALVVMGLALIVFLKPPGRAWLSGGAGEGDWRTTVLAIVLLLAFFVLTWIPLAQRLLYVEPLRQSSDYAVVGLVAIVWVLVTWLVWHFTPLELRRTKTEPET